MLRTLLHSFVISFCIALAASKSSRDIKNDVRSFPDGFLFGTSTASYQVEGAWNEDGKTQSNWDVASHRVPCVVEECATGDVASDSYHQVERDVEMMRELGLDYYRFSLSWNRILPTSFNDTINEAGVQYYNNLINEMLKYNIEPMITIHHWDLPQKLQDMGGWTNPYVVDWFSDYARVCFELFGDRVKYWITINEPKQMCYYGYADPTVAPFLNYTGVADYMCAKNVLLAHAKAYHIYDQEFKSKFGGIVGISIHVSWYEPASDSDDDIAAAETGMEFHSGMFANPIFGKSGDFPTILKEKVKAKSIAQGLPRSRLPELSAEEVAYIKGSADFLGFNHFVANMATRNASVEGYYPSPSTLDDMDIITYYLDEWNSTAATTFKVVPRAIYKTLTAMRENYDNPLIYITENGFSSTGGIEDDDRISYYYQYLDAMLDAIDEGSNVKGYTVWSFMDNFQWSAGYTVRFGLYEVDFTDPARTRTPRKSAFAFKQIVSSRQLDPAYELPQNRTMTIDTGN